MKSYKNLLLLFVATTVAIAHAAVDLSDYLSGKKVDKKNRTILHILAQNSDQDDFEVKLKIFNFAEKKLPRETEELVKNYRDFAFIYQISPEMALMIAAQRMQEYVNHEDENGNTALIYAQQLQEKRVAQGLKPHPRTQFLIEALGMFEPQENEEPTSFLEVGEDGNREELKDELQK